MRQRCRSAHAQIRRGSLMFGPI